MSARIDSVGTEIPGGAPLAKRGAITLSVRAGKKSLKRAGLEPREVGLLINCSVYKDENIGEPALASFIQRDLEANPMSDGKVSTFSFDILDGGCGLITGMEIVDGFISSGEIEHGIVITSDVNPSPKHTVGFRFKNSAAAVVLTRSRDGSGFAGFRQFEFPEIRKEQSARVNFQKDPRKNFIGLRRMRNILTIEESAEFRDLVMKKAAESLKEFLNGMDLGPKDVDLLIPSQYPVGLPQELSRSSRIPPEKVVTLPRNYGTLYSSGLGFGLRWAMKRGSWDKARNIVFLGVSPGLKVALALYRNSKK
ncbi:MAG: 3-oxoacyl-[acyl-carrier-protein] synthase III C-terminal domain-containing protein [Thermoplasmatota archaeon]